MILLDTHVWIWLADESDRLTPEHRKRIKEEGTAGLAISVISCREVAKLILYDRLVLACSIEEWMEGALALPGISLIEITPHIAIESTRLPGPFHRDPADQLIVATARIHDIELLTVDERSLKYPHVRAV